MTKTIKNVFSHQSAVIDKLMAERDELIDRVKILEERLSSALSMITVQKNRISNFSDLVSKLTSIGPSQQTTSHNYSQSQISQQDKLIVEQLLKINTDQFPIYLQQNPFPIMCTQNIDGNSGERFNNILHALPPSVAVEFATCAFEQIFRSSQIIDLVQTLRKSIHNLQFLHKIENFACKLFKAGFCQLFVLQPQQNQLVAHFDNDSFTLQVPLGKGIIGSCAHDGNVMIHQNTQASTYFEPEIDEFFNIGPNPSMTIPIFDSSSNYVIAVLLLHTPSVGNLFTPEDHQIGEVLSRQISPFLTAYVEHLEKSDDRTLRQEISHAVKSLLGKNTLEELLPTTLSAIQQAVSAVDVELYIYDDEQESMYVFEAQIGHDGKQFFARKYYSAKTGIPYHIIQTKNPLQYSRLTPEKCEFFSRETDIAGLGQPYVAVPVFGLTNTPIAVLAAYGKRGANSFSPANLSCIQQIAIQIGVNLYNILMMQEQLINNRISASEGGSFDKPLKSLISGVTTRNLTSKKTLVIEAVAKELAVRVNCDLIGIWEITSQEEQIIAQQAYILKNGHPFNITITTPPIVIQAAKNNSVIQSSIASEVKQMIGTFDEESSFKSYSNVTVPITSGNGDTVSWVIMCENSMSPQGRFMESDISGVTDFAHFLVLLTESQNVLTALSMSEAMQRMGRVLYGALQPAKQGVLKRVLTELTNSLGGSDFVMYHLDPVSEQVNLVCSSSENALKSALYSQGIIGRIAQDEIGSIEAAPNLSEAPGYNEALDGAGVKPASALYVKLDDSYIVGVVSPIVEKFSELDAATVRDNAPLLVHTAEEEREFADAATNKGSGVTSEKRTLYMNKATAPTRADIEEYSDRLFNIMSYSEDDRIIMLLKMFVSQGVIRKLQVPFQKLVQFICSLRSCYNVTPYHNWTHACDVTQFVFSCIIRGRLKQYLNELEIFALLLAAISHDVDHHGLNNAFHKKAKTPLGILYEDRPVMEMHHCATAIRLLQMPEHNVLEGIESYADRTHFYEFFIKIILATDMEKHFTFIKEFEEISKEFDKRNDRHRLLLAQIVVKSGDVSNTTRAFDTASEMAHALTDEFFKQGDLEQQIGIEITPMCDRTKASHISASQVGFYSYIASPLLTALGIFLPTLADNTEQLEKNKRTWEQQKLQWEASQGK